MADQKPYQSTLTERQGFWKLLEPVLWQNKGPIVSECLGWILRRQNQVETAVVVLGLLLKMEDFLSWKWVCWFQKIAEGSFSNYISMQKESYFAGFDSEQPYLVQPLVIPQRVDAFEMSGQAVVFAHKKKVHGT